MKEKKNLIEMLEEAYAGRPDVKIVSGEEKIVHIPVKNEEKTFVLLKRNGCFLVRYNDERDNEMLLSYLKENQYQFIKHSTSLPKGHWYFININTKVCTKGIVGVGMVSDVVGNHAISVEDYIIIVEMFKKYKGLKFIEV